MVPFFFALLIQIEPSTINDLSFFVVGVAVLSISSRYITVACQLSLLSCLVLHADLFDCRSAASFGQLQSQPLQQSGNQRQPGNQQRQVYPSLVAFLFLCFLLCH
mmetsp:Transcript_20028/g.41858  ORF Transcript_20028/g.41858 Transcript_20028/m.41858 type:complete len:105 (-) Transcript_20028:81-395(-)